MHWTDNSWRLLSSVLILLLSLLPLHSQSKYTLKYKAILLEKSEEILFLQVGIKEKTNKNDGEVIKYLAPFGLKKGQPYCAAAQYYCFMIAAEELGLEDSLIPIAKSASSQFMYDDAMKRGQYMSYKAKRHDLIVWKIPKKYRGHIERIISVEKAGYIRTIGFNTSSDNAREGDGVYIKRRNIFHLLGRMKVRGLIGFEVIK